MNKVLVFVLIILPLYSQMYGQRGDNASIISMMNEADPYIMEIESTYSIISKLEFGIISNSVSSPVLLVGGRTYNILVVGERNLVRNLDLTLRRMPEDEYIVVDKFNDNTNLVKTQFTPNQTEYYYFLINVNQYYRDYSKAGYFFIISFN